MVTPFVGDLRCSNFTAPFPPSFLFLLVSLSLSFLLPLPFLWLSASVLPLLCLSDYLLSFPLSLFLTSLPLLSLLFLQFLLSLPLFIRFHMYNFVGCNIGCLEEKEPLVPRQNPDGVLKVPFPRDLVLKHNVPNVQIFTDSQSLSSHRLSFISLIFSSRFLDL